MNYQQKIKFTKANETIELEIDNQLVFVRKSSNNNKEETEVFKSLEAAEDYFYYLKSEFENLGFEGVMEVREEISNGDDEIELPEPKKLKTNPNTGSTPAKLSEKVVEQIRRLGGDIHPEKKTKIVIGGFCAPEAIALWYTHSIPSIEYMTDEYENNSHWVWMMTFCWATSCEEFPAIDKEGKTLSMIGMADRGNYILAIDFNDPDPSDPLVYRFDHYDPEQSVGDGARLSDLLSDLKPEE